MLRDLSILCIALGLVLLALGTEAQPVRSCYPAVPYRVMKSVPDGDYEIKVKIWLRPAFIASKLCSNTKSPFAAGCYDKKNNLIVVPTPKDFNDIPALCVLGHEVFHKLGAEHD